MPDGWDYGTTDLTLPAGWNHTEEAKAKMRGRIVSEKTKELLRNLPSEQRGGWPKGIERPSETRDKLSKALLGCIWITNGTTSTTHRPEEPIPDGWRPGKPRKRKKT